MFYETISMFSISETHMFCITMSNWYYFGILFINSLIFILSYVLNNTNSSNLKQHACTQFTLKILVVQHQKIKINTIDGV